jgi:hypothetical protein
LRLTVATGDFKRRDAAEMLPVSVTAIITDIASKRSIRIPPFQISGSFLPIIPAVRLRRNAVRGCPSEVPHDSSEQRLGSISPRHRDRQPWFDFRIDAAAVLLTFVEGLS